MIHVASSVFTNWIGGLGVFDNVQSLDLMSRVHTKLSDCLIFETVLLIVLFVFSDLEEAEGEDPADSLPAYEGPGPRHVPGEDLEALQGSRVDDPLVIEEERAGYEAPEPGAHVDSHSVQRVVYLGHGHDLGKSVKHLA